MYQTFRQRKQLCVSPIWERSRYIVEKRIARKVTPDEDGMIPRYGEEGFACRGEGADAEHLS